MSDRPGSPVAGPAAVTLVEEAIQLLRRAPAGTLLLYYAGAIPWSVGFLYFWSWAGWFAPGPARLAWAALGLSGLYVWLKFSQAAFCGRLLAVRTGRPPPRFSGPEALRVAAAQLRWHPWGLLLLTPAAILLVPFGWVYAYFQHLTVLLGAPVAGAPPGARAWRQAQQWPAQNHAGLLIFLGVAVAVGVNLAAFVYYLPQLAHSFLGVDTLLAFDGVSLLSTTFLAAAILLAWLVVDPMVKAFYVLRVFYGDAWRTGEDLRGELAVTRAARRVGMAAAALLALGWGLSSAAPRLCAAESAPTAVVAAPAVDPPTLNRAIDEAMRQGDFQWQLRPLPDSDQAETDGGFVRTFLHDCWKTFVYLLRKIRDWIDKVLPSRQTSTAPGAGNFNGVGILSYLLYGLIALAVALIIVVLAVIWQRGRGAVAAISAQAVIPAAPDLQDENVQAAQLPSEAWLALAREKLAAGEWRLALRALYLATLVRLAGEGLLTLARSKTNLDYERELVRRAPARSGTVARFRGWRGEFEVAWYGRGHAAEPQLRSWLAELEKGKPL